MFAQQFVVRKTVTLRISALLRRHIKTSSPLADFWEPDKKGGYVDHRPKPSNIQMITSGFKQLKKEIVLWKEEVKEHLRNDPFMEFRPGETDVLWRFGSEKDIDKWLVTSDSDHNEGYSTCSLTISRHGKGLFCGELNTTIPKDGRVARSGYCNMTTIRAVKSFQREIYLDWGSYNTLILKVRGDGRSYMLNIHCKGFFDVMWNDMFQFVLYTRGGPYWQIARIPFSKFFYAVKGRIQDRQYPIPLAKITNFGISAGDKINGPFSLEVDYIGLEYDPNHTESFAYEMYKTEKFIGGV